MSTVVRALGVYAILGLIHLGLYTCSERTQHAGTTEHRLLEEVSKPCLGYRKHGFRSMCILQLLSYCLPPSHDKWVGVNAPSSVLELGCAVAGQQLSAILVAT